jgi:relaxase-like protein
MPRPPVRASSNGSPFLDLFSAGRAGPHASDRFSSAQIEQIRRTVRRAPEVMVKVTGGGRTAGAVAAHLAYISHLGELDLDTDRGERVAEDGQKDLLKSWHLELSAGQYRPSRGEKTGVAGIKLVHNITLFTPSPTPSEAVLAAAQEFAREKFGFRHPYALALHTHQRHPHVHLVVRAEGTDGQRLHIDKAMLREWREDFAQAMRSQGIAANATPRSVRGQTKRADRNRNFRANRRPDVRTFREKVEGIAKELHETRAITDPARPTLVRTRKAIVAGWQDVAARLEAQGEVELGADARYFAAHLPPVLTDRERLAVEFMRHVKAHGPRETARDDRVQDRTIERTR